MSEKTIQLTADGKKRLQDELHELRTTKRQEVAERIQQAKAYGDISESGEYEDAKTEQSWLEGRIRDLESTLSKAEVISTNGHKKGEVVLGSTVTIEDDTNYKEVYLLVSSAEASSSENKISNESPFGAAMYGKKVGDKFSVNAPVGLLNFKIVKVE